MRCLGRAIGVGLLLAAAGCGGGSTTGGPTGPTPAPEGFLVGRWTGTVTLTMAGRPDAVTPTEWVFQQVPNASGATYTGTAVLHDTWLPVTVGITTVMMPNTPGGQARTSGFYPSPRGCSGTFWSDGTASSAELTGSINGVDCAGAVPGTFQGTVRLTKVR